MDYNLFAQYFKLWWSYVILSTSNWWSSIRLLRSMGNGQGKVLECNQSSENSGNVAFYEDAYEFDFKFENTWDQDPLDLCCPITQDLFVDPVLLMASGQTYERAAIERWLIIEGKRMDPITGQQMSDLSRVPNHAIKGAVALWKTCKKQIIMMNQKLADLELQNQVLGDQNKFLENENNRLDANPAGDLQAKLFEQLEIMGINKFLTKELQFSC